MRDVQSTHQHTRVLLGCKMSHNGGKNGHMNAGIWPWLVRGVPTGLHETDWHPARHSNQVCATAMALQGAKRR